MRVTCPAPLALLAALAVCGPAVAEDRRYPLPAGADLEGVAVGPDRVAIGTSHPGSRSRITQHLDGRTATTSFRSKCVPLEYTPDGSLLLAYQIDPDAHGCCSCPARAVLIDGNGAVVAATGYGHTVPSFSTSGEVLAVGADCGSLHCGSDRIDVHDLGGNPVRTFLPGLFSQAVVIGDGSDAVLLDRQGLRRVRADGTTPWALALPPGDRERAELSFLPPDLLLVERENTGFLVVDLDGVVVRRHAFAPAGTTSIFPLADARPFAPGQVRIAGRQGDWLLDVDDGERVPIAIDRALGGPVDPLYGAAAFRELPAHLVFRGRNEVWVRPIR